MSEFACFREFNGWLCTMDGLPLERAEIEEFSPTFAFKLLVRELGN